MHRHLANAAMATVLTLIGHAAYAAPTIIDFDPGPSTSASGGNEFFTDGAFRVTAVWYTSAGSANWTSVGGHFHFGAGATGNGERQHFNTSTDLQGFIVTRIDGQAFSLTSLDYDVYGTTSIAGFSPTAVQLLLGANFSPAGAVSAATTSVAADMSGAFHTVSPAGFSNMTSLFISSSASTAFDNIVLDAPAGVPEPASFGLAGLALLGLAVSRKRRASA